MLGFLLVVHKDHGAEGKERGAHQGELRGAGHGGLLGLLQAHCWVALLKAWVQVSQ